MSRGVRARRCVGVVTALGCMLVLTGAASAAPTWLGALDLSNISNDVQFPSVAVDQEGEALAIWQQPSGSALEASVHPPDGSWQSPQTIASDADPSDHQVAFDGRGDATAVWLGGTGMESATLPAGAIHWSTLPAVPTSDASGLQLAVDSQGDTVAVWTVTESAFKSIVESAFRPAGTTDWQTPVPLSTLSSSASSDEVTSPQVAVDAQGDATAAWTQTTGSNKSLVWAASRLSANGIWQTPVPLSGSTVSSGSPQVAIDAAGRSTAIWTDASGVHSSDQQVGGSWSTPTSVSSVAGSANPDLAVNPQGTETATWDQPAGSGQVAAEAATRTSGGSWQTPVALSTAQPNAVSPDPRVALDTNGDAVAIWDEFNGSTNTVMAAVRPASGSWPAPASATTLSGASTLSIGKELAVDPQGNAVAIWNFFGTNEVIQAAGYDAAGPLLNALSIPASGTAGEPVTFSVSPVDAWSAVANTTWSFGDGQQASDQTVTHTYTNPGTYTVKVSSADGLGNSSSQSRTITIAAAPKPPTTSKAPTLSAVSETHKKWRETAQKRAPASKRKPKPPVGTTFSFTVDQAATVTLSFGKTGSGRKVKDTCRPATRHNRKRPACRLTQKKGSLSEKVGTGHHKVAFSGRVGTHKLPLGSYTLTLTATNTGKQRSKSATLKFTIVK